MSLSFWPQNDFLQGTVVFGMILARCLLGLQFSLLHFHTHSRREFDLALHLQQHLGARLEQKLKLTPQMIQSIEILLLPQMALEEKLLHEVETNPVLEIGDGGVPSEVPSEHPDERADGAEHQTALNEYGSDQQRDWDMERFGHELRSPSQAGPIDDDAPDKMKAIEATPGPTASLADLIEEQTRFMDASPAVQELVGKLAWALDKRGYLTTPLTELIDDMDQLPEAEQALELIRHCDPAGLGARDLGDCLLLQLEHESGDNSFEEEIVRTYLDELLHNRLPVIAQATGVPVERVQDALEVISSLDPQPGAPYAPDENRIIVPDVMVMPDAEGGWEVSIPDSTLPKVTINGSYDALAKSPETADRDRDYLKEQLSNARFLLDAVKQRRRTLLRIATEIVVYQKDFLDLGAAHLRPLMRQDIADKLGMSVSTVSRAVKDKYAQTPRGIIPLSSFFSGGIASQDGGEGESSSVVKLRIQALIDGEDSRKPLSDQRIADILAKEGLEISRRTVTKYRLAENIGSTRQRRRFD
jgi:RNA polymerase sigma-54 factor